MDTDLDTRRHGVIEVRRIGPAPSYGLTIAGELWAEVEWSPSRRRWCIQDAMGKCLTHIEHMHAQDVDRENAIRVAKRMIRDGSMPSPEEAERVFLERRKESPRVGPGLQETE